MKAPPPGFNIVTLESTDSTNSHVRRELLAGRLSGSGILSARIQTRGRGQGNNAWISDKPVGYLATLYFPKPAPALFESVIRVSVSAAAVLRNHGAAAALKWPNDLLCRRKKIGGILAEEAAEHVLVGIGINLLQTPDDFFPEWAASATSLFLETGRKLLPDGFQEDFLTDYLDRTDPDRCFNEYEKALAILNQRMEINGRPFTVTGVRKNGVLCGRSDAGEPLNFHTGPLRWAHDN